MFSFLPREREDIYKKDNANACIDDNDMHVEARLLLLAGAVEQK